MPHKKKRCDCPKEIDTSEKKTEKKSKASSWIEHVKKVRSKMPKGTSYKTALKEASKTWKK